MNRITTADYYMGRDKSCASELTDEIAANAAVTVGLVNALQLAYGLPLTVSSGWRPLSVNAKVAGAAKKSNHMIGKACDLHDPKGDLDHWCMANLDVLERLGLWLEHPDSTPNWCHVQIVAPHSGNRVFRP